MLINRKLLRTGVAAASLFALLGFGEVAFAQTSTDAQPKSAATTQTAAPKTASPKMHATRHRHHVRHHRHHVKHYKASGASHSTKPKTSLHNGERGAADKKV